MSKPSTSVYQGKRKRKQLLGEIRLSETERRLSIQRGNKVPVSAEAVECCNAFLGEWQGSAEQLQNFAYRFQIAEPPWIEALIQTNIIQRLAENITFEYYESYITLGNALIGSSVQEHIAYALQTFIPTCAVDIIHNWKLAHYNVVVMSLCLLFNGSAALHTFNEFICQHLQLRILFDILEDPETQSLPASLIFGIWHNLYIKFGDRDVPINTESGAVLNFNTITKEKMFLVISQLCLPSPTNRSPIKSRVHCLNISAHFLQLNHDIASMKNFFSQIQLSAMIEDLTRPRVEEIHRAILLFLVALTGSNHPWFSDYIIQTGFFESFVSILFGTGPFWQERMMILNNMLMDKIDLFVNQCLDIAKHLPIILDEGIRTGDSSVVQEISIFLLILSNAKLSHLNDILAEQSVGEFYAIALEKHDTETTVCCLDAIQNFIDYEFSRSRLKSYDPAYASMSLLILRFVSFEVGAKIESLMYEMRNPVTAEKASNIVESLQQYEDYAAETDDVRTMAW